MNTDTLYQIWNTRHEEFKAIQKQRHLNECAEVLYDILIREFEPRLHEFHTAMAEKCRTAGWAGQLEIPLRDFSTRYLLSDDWTPEERRERDDRVVVRGYHDSIEGVPFRVILRDTDVLDRITAKLFGITNFLIRVRHVSYTHDPDLNVEVVVRGLYLCYYPYGLPSAEDKAQLRAAVWRYAARPETPPPAGLTSVPPVIRITKRASTRERAMSEEDEDNKPKLENPCFCEMCTTD